MSVVSATAALETQALGEFDSLMAYCLRTTEAWNSLQEMVSAGHASKVLYPPTGTHANAQQLALLAEQYRQQFLLPFAFQHLASIFESFLFDFLKIILVNNPIQLSQKKQIEVGLALSVPDRATLIDLIAERELNEIKYRKPREWFEFLEKLIHLGCPAPNEIDALAEMKACRDVLSHNAGITNQVYLDKAGALARWVLNERIVIDPPYFQDCWTLARKIVHDLGTTAVARFTIP